MYKNPIDMKNNDAKWSWTFQKAYPIKWTGPVLKADSNTIAFESIELVHQGILNVVIKILSENPKNHKKQVN